VVARGIGWIDPFALRQALLRTSAELRSEFIKESSQRPRGNAATVVETSCESRITGRESEVGGRRSGVGGRRSEVGGRRLEVGGWRSEVGGRRSEVGGRTIQGHEFNVDFTLASDL
jgi:hypothetical protein